MSPQVGVQFLMFNECRVLMLRIWDTFFSEHDTHANFSIVKELTSGSYKQEILHNHAQMAVND